MTILVTGGSGFLGSAVVRKLLEQGAAVRALVRPSSDRRNLGGLPVELVAGDLTQPSSLGPAVRGITALYHVAADYRLWTRDPAPLYRTNVDGTRALLLAAADAGAARIVYTSSVAALGLHHDGTPADETTPASLESMIGHYKRSKYLAEQAVVELVRERGLPAVIVNPSTPVGPRDVRPTPTGRMVLEAARGRMPAYVETGLNIVHVDDVAAGHVQAFERGAIGERYILGGENLALSRILAMIAHIMGRRPPRLRLPHRLVMPLAYAVEGLARIGGARREPLVTVDGVRMSRKLMYFTSAKAAAALGYRSRPAQAALEDAIRWFQGQRMVA